MDGRGVWLVVSCLAFAMAVSVVALTTLWGAQPAGASDTRPPVVEMVADINEGPGTSKAYGFTGFDGYLYFAATDGATGWELWRTSGLGAELFADIDPGSSHDDNTPPGAFTEMNGYLYFGASDGATGVELWRTDGEVASQVADINPGSIGSTPSEFAILDNFLYFRAGTGDPNTGSTGVSGFEQELYRSNGSTITQKMDINQTEIFGYPGGSVPQFMTTFNGHVYFSAVASNLGASGDGREPWRVSGTTPQRLGDLRAGVSSSFPNGFFQLGGQLFFNASGDAGNGVWRVLGSGAEFVAAGSVGPGPLLGDYRYFNGASGETYDELFRFDGESREMVADLNPVTGSRPENFSRLGDHVYFAAADNTHGRELWRTDGETTEMVEDINAGSAHSYPANLTELGGFIYFSADDGVHGAELWRTNGTITELVRDFNPGPETSYLGEFKEWENRIYFVASDGADSHGREVWRVSVPPAGIEGPPGADSCFDEVDNDEDTFIDEEDPGCLVDESVDVSLTVSPATQVYGKPGTLTVSASPAAYGTVSVTAAEQDFESTMTGGAASVAIGATALGPGTHHASVSYAGIPGLYKSAGANTTITVSKAAPVVKLKAAKATIKRGKTLKFTVRVSADGVVPTGKVKVSFAGKSATAKLKNGSATLKIKVAKKAKTGSVKATASFTADPFVANGKAKAVKVKITG